MSTLPEEFLASTFPCFPTEMVREICTSADEASAAPLRQLLSLSSGSRHWLWCLAEEVRKRQRKLVVLLRGLPGSGKSTLAEAIRVACEEDDDVTSSVVVVCADDFFLDSDGNFTFISSLLGKAHEWAQIKARKAMKTDDNRIVVVDNTNLQIWEMLPYIKMAGEAGYSVLLLEPQTEWRLNLAQLARKTRHGVPFDKLKLMKNRMEIKVDLKAVVSNLPENFRPTCLNLDELILEASRDETSQMEPNQSNGVPEEVQETQHDIESPPPAPAHKEFQTLLQCFPDRSVHQIYLSYLMASGDVDRSVNILLDDNDDDARTDRFFDLQLDLNFASSLEAVFGPAAVRRPQMQSSLVRNLPGPIAKAVHHFWKITQVEQLSEEAVMTIMEQERPKATSNWAPQNQSGSKTKTEDADDVLEEDEENAEDFYCDPAEIRIALRDLKERRAEYYQKAAAAFKARQGGVAAYYSEEGRKLSAKISQYQEDARYQQFLSSYGDKTSLDLHGLSVSHALEHVEWFLELQQNRRIPQPVTTAAAAASAGKRKTRVEIITGRGGLSSASRAKIKPAVEAYLKRKDLVYTEANPGSFEVVIKH